MLPGVRNCKNLKLHKSHMTASAVRQSVVEPNICPLGVNIE